jgi:lycopene cyclase domain-containing protein
MPVRFQYFAILGLCVVGTLFLEFRFDARIWRRPVRVIKAMLPPYLLFNFVDEFAVFRKLWYYSPKYTVGFMLPRRYPIEEAVFFAVIPLCALLTYEAAMAVYTGRVSPVGSLSLGLSRGRALPSPYLKGATSKAREHGLAGESRSIVSWKAVVLTGVLAFVGLIVVVIVSVTDSTDVREYPILVVALLAGVLGLELAVWHTEIFRMRAYWVTMAICLFFMVLVNGWLTKLSAPIVLYAPDEFSGFRPIWDIPIEDFGFGFALLTLVLMSWKRSGQTVS